MRVRLKAIAVNAVVRGWSAAAAAAAAATVLVCVAAMHDSAICATEIASA